MLGLLIYFDFSATLILNLLPIHKRSRTL